jgi:hypothetical protein
MKGLFIKQLQQVLPIYVHREISELAAIVLLSSVFVATQANANR